MIRLSRGDDTISSSSVSSALLLLLDIPTSNLTSTFNRTIPLLPVSLLGAVHRKQAHHNTDLSTSKLLQEV